MNCETYRQWISEHLDGVLDKQSERALLDHLAGCEACRGQMEAIKRAVALVRSLPEASPPPDLLASIHRRLEARERAKPSFWRILSLPQTRVALAAAAVLIVFVYGYQQYFQPSDDSAARPPAVGRSARPEPGPAVAKLDAVAGRTEAKSDGTPVESVPAAGAAQFGAAFKTPTADADAAPAGLQTAARMDRKSAAIAARPVFDKAAPSAPVRALETKNLAVAEEAMRAPRMMPGPQMKGAGSGGAGRDAVATPGAAPSPVAAAAMGPAVDKGRASPYREIRVQTSDPDAVKRLLAKHASGERTAKKSAAGNGLEDGHQNKELAEPMPVRVSPRDYGQLLAGLRALGEVRVEGESSAQAPREALKAERVRAETAEVLSEAVLSKQAASNMPMQKPQSVSITLWIYLVAD